MPENEKQTEFNIEETYPRYIKRCGTMISLCMNQLFNDAGFEVTGAQWTILAILEKRDGITQQELSDINDTRKVTVFRSVEKLEKLGLVVRREDEADRRCKRVYLTPRGHEVQAQLTSIVVRVSDELARGVSSEDIAAMERVLGTIIANASAICKY